MQGNRENTQEIPLEIIPQQNQLIPLIPTIPELKLRLRKLRMDEHTHINRQEFYRKMRKTAFIFWCILGSPGILSELFYVFFNVDLFPLSFMTSLAKVWGVFSLPSIAIALTRCLPDYAQQIRDQISEVKASLVEAYTNVIHDDGVLIWDDQSVAEEMIKDLDDRICDEIFRPDQVSTQREIKRIEQNLQKMAKLDVKGHISIQQNTIFYDNFALESIFSTTQTSPSR